METAFQAHWSSVLLASLTWPQGVFRPCPCAPAMSLLGNIQGPGRARHSRHRSTCSAKPTPSGLPHQTRGTVWSGALNDDEKTDGKRKGRKEECYSRFYRSCGLLVQTTNWYMAELCSSRHSHGAWEEGELSGSQAEGVIWKENKVSVSRSGLKNPHREFDGKLKRSVSINSVSDSKASCIFRAWSREHLPMQVPNLSSACVPIGFI